MKCYSYIRFSKKEQADGRSYDRQMEAARSYADKKGWFLDESLSMYDPGLSGFHREHVDKGALGIFLKAVEAGEIPTPSALLVENLDRLSRENLLDAQVQFISILKAGITIVTLMDDQVYSYDKIKNDPSGMFISIAIMYRAYDESKRKQERRSDVWASGRQKALDKGYKIPARCVAWLEWNKERTGFIEIPERVALVRRIYDMYISGMGIMGIAKKLNDEKVPTFQKSAEGWGTTTIRRALTTRTVLGEMQFQKTVSIKNGSRKYENVGEPVKDYYPQIIPDEIFYEAQRQEALRKGKYGKIGEMNNLFSSIARCGYCGAVMGFSTTGRNQKRYLYCRQARLHNCEGEIVGFRYDHFEEAFLSQCTRLNLSQVVKDNISEHEQKLKNLQSQLLTVSSKLDESEKKVLNFTEAIGTGSTDTVEHFVSLINAEKELQKEYRENKTTLLRELNRLEKVHEQTANSLTTLRETVERVSRAKGDERTEIRRKLQKVIRELVERIDFYPKGPNFLKYKKKFDKLDLKSLPKDDQKWWKDRCGRKGKFYRQASIYFRSGGLLCFMHNHDTEGLKVMLEFEPTPEGDEIFGTIVRSSLKKITKKSKK